MRFLIVLSLCISLLLSDVLTLNYVKDSVEVHDGDTFYVDIDLDNCPAVLCKHLSIRVLGIDAPEIRTKSKNEKKLAILAKELLADFLKNNTVYIHNCSRDKFFRLDCELLTDKGVDFAELILGNNLAIRYSGDKKTYDWAHHKQ